MDYDFTLSTLYKNHMLISAELRNTLDLKSNVLCNHRKGCKQFEKSGKTLTLTLFPNLAHAKLVCTDRVCSTCRRSVTHCDCCYFVIDSYVHRLRLRKVHTCFRNDFWTVLDKSTGNTLFWTKVIWLALFESGIFPENVRPRKRSCIQNSDSDGSCTWKLLARASLLWIPAYTVVVTVTMTVPGFGAAVMVFSGGKVVVYYCVTNCQLRITVRLTHRIEPNGNR